MGRPLKISKLMTAEGVGKDIGYPAISSLTAAVTPSGLTSTEFYGVVGGQIQADGGAAAGPGLANPVVMVRVKITGETESYGFIVRQKGSRKYLVEDANGNVGTCVLADVDDALSDGEMTITVFTGDSSAIRLKKLTNKYATDWSDNVYFVNMFQGVDGETAVKSGSANNGTILLARIEFQCH
jgi:hypothetical protein